MIGYIWALMIAAAVSFGAFSGNMTAVSDSMLKGATDGFELFLIMAAVMCLWNGLMNIASKSRLSRAFSLILRPFNRLVFPNLDVMSPAFDAISMNITANMLGLGNAATPIGIHAMQELKKQAVTGDTASRDMIFFVVLNSVSIQLVPTGVAAIRAAADSSSPLEIMPAVWIASIGSALFGIVLAVICDKVTSGKKNIKQKVQVV